MRTAVCPLCVGFWTVLQDGTLAQHSEARFSFLLCPGSRSSASGESRDPPPKLAGSAQAGGRRPVRRLEPHRLDRGRARLR
jgi:hypothetical protein